VKDPTVLVVEQDEDARIILATALRATGYDCLVTADGATALDLARSSHVALVVADLYIPCGAACLIEALKSDPSLRRLPVLAYAGYVFPSDRQRARELGCVGFIPKPAGPAEVMREIRRWVGAPSKSAAGLAECR
jgi:CheY-like chemotaxis protein